MKIFLDDIRNPATGGWIVCRTAKQAVFLIDTGLVKEISFDHDLGDNVPTGYDVAKRIEQLVFEGVITMPKWGVHSANPVGRKNIENCMISAERFSKRG